MQRPSVGIMVLLGALAVPVLAAAAGRAQQSRDEQRAKEHLARTKTEVQEDRDALAAKMREQRAHVEESAESRQDKIEANAEREVASLQADTREQMAALDQATQEKQQQLEERLNAAEQKAAEAAKDTREGVITSINATARVVTIQDPEGASAGPLATAGSSPVTPLLVAEGAKVEHGGQALSLREVQVGDRVQLQLGGAAGQREVQHILIVERAMLGQGR